MVKTSTHTEIAPRKSKLGVPGSQWDLEAGAVTYDRRGFGAIPGAISRWLMFKSTHNRGTLNTRVLYLCGYLPFRA